MQKIEVLHVINMLYLIAIQEGQTKLHVAATDGDLSKALQLIQDAIGLNLQDKCGWTALHCAAYSRNKQVFSLLLAQDEIEVSPRNDSGSTPLHYFARNFDSAHYNEEQVYKKTTQINFLKTFLKEG